MSCPVNGDFRGIIQSFQTSGDIIFQSSLDIACSYFASHNYVILIRRYVTYSFGKASLNE
jgi:hypothetical protein